MRLLAELQMEFRISAEEIELPSGTVYMECSAIFFSRARVRVSFEITAPEAER